MIDRALAKIFGTQHERDLKKLAPRVEEINALEPAIHALSDEALRATLDDTHVVGDGRLFAFRVIVDGTWGFASAVDLIVQQSRLKDGSRRIVNITEVQGMEGDVIVMQDVFVFEQTGVVEGKIQGRLKPTGIRPKFVEKFEVMGIHLPPGLFGFNF